MNTRTKKLAKFFLFYLVFILSSGLVLASQSAAAGAVKITVVHTNDVHSRVGCEPYVAALVKEKKAAGENVLLLSAGDALHGQPLATLTRGAAIVEIMNAAGYDAMAPGNHDFNYGADRLLELTESMRFPVLAANIKNKTGKNIFPGYVIKEIGGVKVGVFGLATPETATKTNPLNVRGLTFTSPVTAARKAVAELKNKKCDVIIGLLHLGIDGESLPKERSTAVAAVSGIDLLVDGHSHTVLENGLSVGGTLIVQTGSYGKNIGVVELTVSEGKVTGKSAALVAVPTKETPNPALIPDVWVAFVIRNIEAENKKYTAQAVGSTAVSLQGEREYARTRETNLGNLIADSMLHASQADVALTNGGGIRASIAAGPITQGDVITVLPFGNYIVVKELTGAAIKEALEHGVKNYPAPAGGFPQVAGMRFTFDPAAETGSKVVEVTLADGTPMKMEQTYRLATNDFIAAGGDGYTMIGDAGGTVIFSAMDEALIDYLRISPLIKDGPEGRINALEAAEKATEAAPEKDFISPEEAAREAA